MGLLGASADEPTLVVLWMAPRGTMIHSMTGFGAAQRQGQGVEAAIEVRSVNGRFLKLGFRLPPRLAAREHELEALVRTRVRRGSITVKVVLRETSPEALVQINEDVVRAYQLAFRRLGIPEQPLATLPGVLEGASDTIGDERFAVVRDALAAALEALTVMRRHEGSALERLVLEACAKIESLAQTARARAPAVVTEYRGRLRDRLAVLVDGFGKMPLDDQLVAREVALMADRADVTEELDRIAAHLTQARAVLAGDDEAGRTLEFLAQELLREINTLGSKSADSELTRLVIGAKSELERLREQIANIE